MKKICYDPLISCKFKVTRNRYCGSSRSEFKKADLCASLMYSTGSSARPAGLAGRPCSVGHRSLMSTSFTETLALDDRERETIYRKGMLEIWTIQGTVSFGEERERRWELEQERDFFILALLHSVEKWFRDLPKGSEDRTVKAAVSWKKSTKRKWWRRMW